MTESEKELLAWALDHADYDERVTLKGRRTVCGAAAVPSGDAVVTLCERVAASGSYQTAPATAKVTCRACRKWLS